MILCFLSFRMANVEISPTHTCLSKVHPMFLAFTPLMVPCMDVVRVFIFRLKCRKNPFMPDKSHIHHKLLSLGLSQHVAMISILFFSAFIIVISLILSKEMNPTLLFMCIVAFFAIINIWMHAKIEEKKAKANG